MTEFSFDTSGAVEAQGPISRGIVRYEWRHLSPFVQGYVEGAKREYPLLDRLDFDGSVLDLVEWGFSGLDPSALALILRDCEAFNARIGDASHNRGVGAKFWESRQAGFNSFWSLHQAEFRDSFPPQQPYLSDEGRVCLREGQ